MLLSAPFCVRSKWQRRRYDIRLPSVEEKGEQPLCHAKAKPWQSVGTVTLGGAMKENSLVRPTVCGDHGGPLVAREQAFLQREPLTGGSRRPLPHLVAHLVVDALVADNAAGGDDGRVHIACIVYARTCQLAAPHTLLRQRAASTHKPGSVKAGPLAGVPQSMSYVYLALVLLTVLV